MILFELLHVYCFDSLKVETFLKESDSNVPEANKLMMKACLAQKYICGYLLKEISLSKKQKMDAIANLKSVYGDINKFLQESVVLLKELHKSKTNLENKLEKIKVLRCIAHYKKQLTLKTAQIEGIEAILKILRKAKRCLQKLNKQIAKPTKTICIESHLHKMRHEARCKIKSLLKMYEDKMKVCVKV